jgi:hypothetical protein
MGVINYKHLHYFWAVAREGGIARGAELLHVTPQTVSGQVSRLEKDVGAVRNCSSVWVGSLCSRRQDAPHLVMPTRFFSWEPSLKR